MAQLATNSSEEVTNFEKTLESTNENINNCVEIIEEIEGETFISLIKIDHILFKSSAYKSVVSGKIDMDFSDHHKCSIGQWYQNEGRAKFGETPSYKAIEKPHITVHDMINKNLKLAESSNGVIKHKEKIIENFKIMEKSSEELLNFMDRLVKEKRETANSENKNRD
jgi:hypothetical protein